MILVRLIELISLRAQRHFRLNVFVRIEILPFENINLNDGSDLYRDGRRRSPSRTIAFNNSRFPTIGAGNHASGDFDVAAVDAARPSKPRQLICVP